MGFGFWHPTSEMPEQGLCHFPMLKDAEEYRDFLCSKECASPLDYNDLSIEFLDEELEMMPMKIKEFLCNLVSQHQLNDRGYIKDSNWKRWFCFCGLKKESRVTFAMEKRD